MNTPHAESQRLSMFFYLLLRLSRIACWVELIELERGLPYQAAHIRPQHTMWDLDLPYQAPTYHIRPRSYRSALTVFMSRIYLSYMFYVLTVVPSNALIMVIELSGVQFGLKSYAWFQNWTSAQREFDLKSQVWFQTKIARPEVQLPLY